MSATRARWRRLSSGLAPEARLRLVVRAWKAGDDADPTLLLDAPPEQRAEVQRLGKLQQALSVHLGWLPISLHQDVIQLWTQLALAASLAVSSGLPAAQPLLDDLGERAARTWREAKALEQLAGEVEEEIGEHPLHPVLRDVLASVCRELQAMAEVVEELPGCEITLAGPTPEDLARLDGFVALAMQR